MIRFNCTRCSKRLKANENWTGRKIYCPRCGERLLIPPAIRTGPEPEPAPALIFEPSSSEECPAPDYEHPAPSSRPVGPLVVSVALIMFAAVVGLIIVAVKSQDNTEQARAPAAPPPSRERSYPDRDRPAYQPRQPRYADSRPTPNVDRPPRPAKPAEQQPIPDRDLEFEPGSIPSVPSTGKPPAGAPPVAQTPPTPAKESELEKWNRAIAENPKDAKAYFERGKLHFKRSDLEQAVRDYNQAIQLDPEQKEYYAQRDLAFKKRLESPIPGYTLKKIEGFQVLIASEVFGHNDDAEFSAKPLDILNSELATATKALPEWTRKPLQLTVPIWIQWHDDKDPDIGKALAKYYGTAGAIRFHLWNLGNKQALMANSIEVISMRALTLEHQPNVEHQRCILLHELAHAFHFRRCDALGFQQVKLAYLQAMDRKLYEQSRNANKDQVSAYAGTNEYEYFAEMSCAYLAHLNYFPFKRSELEKYDPTGFAIMRAAWTQPVGDAGY